MEGKSSAGNKLMPNKSCGFLGLEGSMQVNHDHNPRMYQNFMIPPQQVESVFPVRVRNTQPPDKPVPFLDSNNNSDRVNKSISDDDRSNILEEGAEGHNDGCRGKKESQWQRVKWTDKMVKLLITAVSYTEEDASSDYNVGGRRNSFHLPKKGKWKAISKVMAERGYPVSPQQCEDKFNDLNKRYKRLNDILGRGTSCKVVENPMLLDLMDLSDKAKEDVRKILSSKQLFYQEMCSFHNGNRLYLPHDDALQQSLLFVLKSKEDYGPPEMRPHNPDELDGKDENAASDGRNVGSEQDYTLPNTDGRSFELSGVSAKRSRQAEEYEEVQFGNALNLLDCSKRSDLHLPNDSADVNHVVAEDGERELLHSRWIMSRSLQLKEQKLQIQAQMLELEKQRLKWLRCSEQEDREVDKMRLENECMRLENERLALELKRQEMSAGYS